MSTWDRISDEEMRAESVYLLSNRMDQYLRQAKREDAKVAAGGMSPADQIECEGCARYSRRQAAHFQQAIDLLKAAPMPASEEAK